MRYTEAAEKDRIKQEPKAKKEKPRVLAGDEKYDYMDLGMPRVMLGGNSWS